MNTGRNTGWIKWVLLLMVLAAVNFIHLPYYFSVPGDAQTLTDVIEVEDGYAYEGSFALTTIRMGKANSVNYIWSLLSDRRELMHENEVRPPGESDDMYNHRQMMLMSTSQQQSVIAAYEAAGREASFEEYGVVITSIIPGMDAEEKLESGDRITSVNETEVRTADELLDSVSGAEAGEVFSMTIVRNDEEMDVEVTAEEFPEEFGAEEGRAGIGISNPVTDRELITDPEVDISTSQIGGPSAGLMFALEIYNQLTEEDITRGLSIAGTGSISENGTVGSIGGISQKIYAADEDNMDIFFAPDLDDTGGLTNFEAAQETAESIGTDMEIVPVTSLEDALGYLESISG
ncbi:SepM family pheromone-processing serine protease [Alkalicoccus urumqiensis]|uniref:PDZ domain-containing protein n=1 Tax=Alkalicoccus urumqiensis TaxID=1548213 RepID=A0A2P6MEQ1_ALKUR|nr:SepM family pheromone-processing serine protease [Alkalicoccus urumqiensis]PRO64743.1 hypothetical protein C6I21_12590 [Alkalicoccus urumqiensis]